MKNAKKRSKLYIKSTIYTNRNFTITVLETAVRAVGEITPFQNKFQALKTLYFWTV